MSIRTTLLASALGMLLALAAAAPASASTAINVSPAGPITLSPPISFVSGGLRFSCQTTFSGTFQRQIRKAPGALFGSLTGAVTTSCTPGYNAAFLLSAAAPVNLTYTSFLGTLPNMTGIGVLLNGFAVLVTTPVGSCLYRGTIGGLFSTPGNPVNPNGSTTMPLVATLAGSCPATLTVAGVGPYGPAQTFTLV